MSQKDLAQRVGVTSIYLCNVEKEKKQCSPELLERIGEELKVPVIVFHIKSFEVADLKANQRVKLLSWKNKTDKIIEDLWGV